MGQIAHRNPIRIATTTQEREQDAINDLKARELLYNRNNKSLGIVLEDQDGNKYRQIVSGLVDDINITKNDQYETKLKENVVIDSITAQADHNGIDWKSQIKLGTTSAEKSVILLFKQDDIVVNNIAVFGGDIIEIGNNVESHYQISVTSTGSHTLRGATTNKKRGKICLVKYQNSFYYGIHFVESSPANIYFAGWQKIPTELTVPAADYKDGDMSEIVDLDDESDIGIQVVDYDFINYDDILWEFDDAPIIYNTATTSKAYALSQSTLTRKNFLSDEGTYFGRGYSHQNPSYTLNFYSNISYTAPDGELLRANHQLTLDSYYIALKSEGVVSYLDTLNGVSEITITAINDEVNPVSIRIMKVKPNNCLGEVVAQQVVKANSEWATVVFSNIPAGNYYIYQTGSVSYSSISIQTTATSEIIIDANWNQEGNNENYNLTNGLEIASKNNTSWYDWEISNNTGYIIFEGVNDITSPAMKLHLFGKATITVGFNTKGPNSANLRITESLDTKSELWRKSVSGDSQNTDKITEVVYNYDSGRSDVWFLGETGPVNILYVKLDYEDTLVDDGLYAVQEIYRLPDTGEEGQPHILRLRGKCAKVALQNLAASLKDSNVQIVLDLSRCSMESTYTDWSNDEELSSIFDGCTSLREFYYPLGVTSSGANTFRNCTFLRAIHFDKDMKRLGAPAATASNGFLSSLRKYFAADTNPLTIDGMFSGARIKTLVIPSNVSELGGYPFSNSNILNIFFKKNSAFINNNILGESNTFLNTNEKLRFRCPQDLYNVWSKKTTTFQNLGANGDGINKIGPNCRWSSHVVLWEDPDEELDYTKRYESRFGF